MTGRRPHRTAPPLAARRAAPLLALLPALLLALPTAPAAAQGQVRAMGLAGAYTAAARGLDAVGWNPANLALRRPHGVEVGLASVAMDLNNNAFSLERYNEISGATLDAADKQRLLDDIPDEGFMLNADVRASALGICVGPVALSLQGLAGGTGTLDKDFFDLVLMGNEIDESFSFEDTDGEGFALASGTLSFAAPLLTSRAVRLSAGVNARYLHGFYDLRVESASGSVVATMTEVRGEAAASYLTSRGGTGYAVDAGLALQAPRGWVLGLAVSNAASRIEWDRDVERTTWRASVDSLAMDTDEPADRVVDEKTVAAAAPYARSLPTTVRLGASNTLGPLLLAVDAVKPLDGRAGAGRRVELNLGVEWRPCGWLRPRLGLGFGGDVDRSAAGLGVALGPLCWDLAVANRGAFIPDDTKGLAAASGVSLAF